MSDLDVSLRLRLVNDLSKEAGKAERDLKDLENTARKLGKAGGADKLGKDITDLGADANRSEKQVHELEKAARRLGTVKTDAAEGEIRALGTAARKAKGDVDVLYRRIGDGKHFSAIDKPAGALNGTLVSLKGSATNAFAGLAAFASVDTIVRGLERLSDQYQKLNRDVASVAITAEMRTPEAIERISKSNAELSLRYGTDQTDVNNARKTYAAAGIGLDQQEAVLDPTLKAAKAGDSTGETMATAVIAAQQNMGVKDSEVPLALDMMAKGSKLGSFEVDAMAKNFPALATMLAGTGREGTGGWAELVALAQVVRMGAGSQDQASQNLQNLLAKVTSPDTIKNFDEAGVSLPKLKAKADKEGKPYLTAIMDEVMRLTGGDEFKIGELFGDQQAKLALAPLLNNREKYDQFLKEILTNSSGTVDADYDFVRPLPKEKADRRAAALQATGDTVGKWYDDFLGPLKDHVVRTINPDYARQEDAYDNRQQLKGADLDDLRALIGERESQLSGMPLPKFSDIDALASGRQTLQQEITRLKAILESAERVQDDGNLGKSRGSDFIPIPTEKPLSKDMSGAADEAMSGYNERLRAAADTAVSIAQDAAQRMLGLLNFTATPTIQPNFVPTGGGGEKHTSLPSPAGGNKVTQNIYTPNTKQAALRSTREQNRAIRQANARSYSGTGRSLA
jgi:TP901 family phage tail tape measure protein